MILEGFAKSFLTRTTVQESQDHGAALVREAIKDGSLLDGIDLQSDRVLSQTWDWFRGGQGAPLTLTLTERYSGEVYSPSRTQINALITYNWTLSLIQIRSLAQSKSAHGYQCYVMLL